jgi:CxxC motif-containing protein (DUF1111 family)
MNRKVAVPLLSVAALAIAGAFLLESGPALSIDPPARDPGVRGGNAGAGDAVSGLSVTQNAFFQRGKEEFNAVEEPDEGLGPRMNLDSCGGCHSQPAAGGTSPAVNPQVAFASAAAPSQLSAISAFVRLDGPVREARFVHNPDGTADGGVHALFTVTGRAGGDGCNIAQPNFAPELANNNVIFRIPTPTFGLGLVEQITDAAIVANQAANAGAKSALGIKGKPNFHVAGRTITGMTNNNGNDGTIARFGWKAQNKSLLLFSGEAYNVEMGITNEIFQTERDETPTCQLAPVPNDVQNFDAANALDGTTAIQSFSNFMRLLDAPQPAPATPSTNNGKRLFSDVGCALCHTPSFTTSPNSNIEQLRNKPVNLFSDLLVHDMGNGLADGVSQGEAGPREFRTAPLWGVGQRIFFLHDGRTSDLLVAIRQHRSFGSEANGVVNNFNNLREGQKQDVLNFLRSL